MFSEPLYKILGEVSLKTSTKIIYRFAKPMAANVKKPINVNIALFRTKVVHRSKRLKGY